jgi:hypothetical protein
MKKLSQNETMNIIDDIITIGESLFNDWERDFLESLQNNQYPELTKKQTAKLFQIHDKVTHPLG